MKDISYFQTVHRVYFHIAHINTLQITLSVTYYFFLSLNGIATTYLKNVGESFETLRVYNHKGFPKFKKLPSLNVVFFVTYITQTDHFNYLKVNSLVKLTTFTLLFNYHYHLSPE